jgi:hypothetical protein
MSAIVAREADALTEPSGAHISGARLPARSPIGRRTVGDYDHRGIVFAWQFGFQPSVAGANREGMKERA